MRLWVCYPPTVKRRGRAIQGGEVDALQRLVGNHRAEMSHGSASLLLCLSLSLLLLVSEKGSCVAQAGLRLANSGRWPWPPDSPAFASSHTILLPALIAVLPKPLQILTCSRTREQLAQILKEKNKTFKKLFKQKYVLLAIKKISFNPNYNYYMIRRFRKHRFYTVVCSIRRLKNTK